MRSNIETIKYTGVCSAIFALLTYLVTLNMENGFFRLNSSWISNSFVLTICGGAFASFLVLLLCELQKYRSNKLSCEDYMFCQAMYLYSALFSMYKNTGEYLENKHTIVAENCLDANIHIALSQITALQSVDYIVFCKRNILVQTHQIFCIKRIPQFRSAIERYGIYLKLAINTVQLNNLKEYGNSGTITPKDETVAKTLIKINNELKELVAEISNYLSAVDQNSKGKYNWAKIKGEISEGCISIFGSESFEDFIKDVEVPQ